MQGWDFTSPGLYFVTICSKKMKPVFGTVVSGRVVLNNAGKIADKLWREIPAHFPRAVVDEHVVMPNHGNLRLKPGEAVVSGFLSPMERAVFRALLARKRPMIWVLPAGLDAIKSSSTACRGAIEEGRLLVLSPFAQAIDAPNARRAAWCNHYAVIHSDRIVVGHLTPDGMLACILAEANPETEIINL